MEESRFPSQFPSFPGQTTKPHIVQNKVPQDAADVYEDGSVENTPRFPLQVVANDRTRDVQDTFS
jgi:hypothetical protein